MEIGLGVLGRPAAVFWAMTMPELSAALDGYLEARGVRAERAAPPSREELRELMARFPDLSPEAAALPLRRVDRPAHDWRV